MHKMEISLGQRYYQFLCVCVCVWLREPLTTRHSEVLHYPSEAGRAVTYSELLRLCLDLRQKKTDSQTRRRLRREKRSPPHREAVIDSTSPV